LGGLNGGGSSSAFAVNSNGSVVVGIANDGAVPGFRAFRWAEPGGMVSLGVLSGTTYSYATAVNSDGSVVVGSAFNGQPGNMERAFRWTQVGGMVNLGTLNGGTVSNANGVNSDGSVVVGIATDGMAGNASRAFRWTQAGGMVSLGALNNGDSSFAHAVNSDGTVVVGQAADGAAGNTARAFRWTQAGGMVSLGALNGGNDSGAIGVSRDGTVVVGIAADGTTNPNQYRAFRWTQAGGMVSLGVLSNGIFSSARGVSSDGNVVVGISTLDRAGLVSRAFRWTQTTGMRSVEDWLRVHGVSVPVDITQTAEGVNADGSVVVGTLTSGFAYIARVATNGSGGSGLVTLQDLLTSLAGNSTSPAQAASAGGLVLHGSHSRPLSRRVEPGKSCVWTSGDLGRDDHDSRDGRIGLAEVGACYSFASKLQGSLSFGQNWSLQNLPFNGKSDVRATYGIAEILGKVTGNVWASGAVLYQRGDADAQRGYLNAGVQDLSRGRPGVQTQALRLRLDWEDAARLGQATLSPYADASHARARIDAYTENGGGFPARFDARTEKATELRLGADAAYPLSAHTKLLGRLEATHRIEKTGAPASGTVLGLFDFNLPGQHIKRDWLRASIGFDTMLGGGTLSAMLNTTTAGAVPSYWMNFSFQVAY